MKLSSSHDRKASPDYWILPPPCFLLVWCSLSKNAVGVQKPWKWKQNTFQSNILCKNTIIPMWILITSFSLSIVHCGPISCNLKFIFCLFFRLWNDVSFQSLPAYFMMSNKCLTCQLGQASIWLSLTDNKRFPKI